MSTNGSDDPIILSFALTAKEWAAVAATLTAMGEVTKRATDMKHGVPLRVAEATAMGTRFSEMIRDEMGRISR